MANESLAKYLNDHLAGSVVARTGFINPQT
jgi:hypothetical protein